MEKLNVNKIGLNGMLVNLKEFKADKQETIKRWISRDNYSQFKSELEQYCDDRVTIFLNGAVLGHEMEKQDVEIMIDCLVQAEGFVEQGEDFRYNFYLDNRLVYTIDLDIF